MDFRSFVAFDLETTGTDPATDSIIQVGIAKARDGQIVEEREFLVNPLRPIPVKIKRLTGISDEMVAGRPPVEELLPELLEHLEGMPLVAHNAEFDLEFLNTALGRAGLKRPPAPVYDTVELSRIIFPLAPNHRLTTMAELCGIPLEQAHTAGADARATAAIFLRFLDELTKMDPRMLHAILRLSEPFDWPLKPLIGEAVEAAASRGAGRAQHLAGWPPFSPRPGGLAEINEDLPAFTPPDIETVFGVKGGLTRSMGAFEHRPSQLQMASLVRECIEGGRHLLVEAGTGTGKSLAYLIPAVCQAIMTGRQAMVFTHTINLQEQLLDKDVPLARKALGVDFRAALVKGRGNYLCIRKWRETVETASTDPLERGFHIRLAAWLGQTPTGDRAELNLYGRQEELWNDVCSDPNSCLGSRCEFNRDSCFVTRARHRASSAHVLVGNHSVLLADIKAGKEVLPDACCVVIDEAHHLEDAATEHLGERLSGGSVTRLLSSIERLLSRFTGLREDGIGAVLDDLSRLVARTREASLELFKSLAGLPPPVGSREESHVMVRIDSALRAAPEWGRAEEYGRETASLLNKLARELSGVAAAAETKGNEALSAECEGAARGCLEAASALQLVLDPGREDVVSWAETGANSNPVLRAAPLEVGRILRQKLFAGPVPVVLTSATLTVGGGFDHITGRLGLDALEPVSASFESPFNYAERAILCLATGLPDPRTASTPDLAEGLAAFLSKLVVRIHGGTLVLFTSHKLLRWVHHILRPMAEREDICVLAQGIDGGRSRLVEEFVANDRSVLLGAASFWEGVDIPGDDLRCVVLARLPFAPPMTPVQRARAERLEKKGLHPFYSMSLPDAVLKFKQGVGRLIRRSSDRGAVVVLDPRLASGDRSYGRAFLESLPPMRVLKGDSHEVIEAVARWLKM